MTSTTRQRSAPTTRRIDSQEFLGEIWEDFTMAEADDTCNYFFQIGVTEAARTIASSEAGDDGDITVSEAEDFIQTVCQPVQRTPQTMPPPPTPISRSDAWCNLADRLPTNPVAVLDSSDEVVFDAFTKMLLWTQDARNDAPPEVAAPVSELAAIMDVIATIYAETQSVSETRDRLANQEAELVSRFDAAYAEATTTITQVC